MGGCMAGDGELSFALQKAWWSNPDHLGEELRQKLGTHPLIRRAPEAQRVGFLDRVATEVQTHEVTHGSRLAHSPSQTGALISRVVALAHNISTTLSDLANNDDANAFMGLSLAELQYLEVLRTRAVRTAIFRVQWQAAHVNDDMRSAPDPAKRIAWFDQQSTAGLPTLLHESARLLAMVAARAKARHEATKPRRGDGRSTPTKEAQRALVYSIGRAFVAVFGKVPPFGRRSSFLSFVRLLDERIGDSVVSDAMAEIARTEAAKGPGRGSPIRSVCDPTKLASSEGSDLSAAWHPIAKEKPCKAPRIRKSPPRRKARQAP